MAPRCTYSTFNVYPRQIFYLKVCSADHQHMSVRFSVFPSIRDEVSFDFSLKNELKYIKMAPRWTYSAFNVCLRQILYRKVCSTDPQHMSVRFPQYQRRGQFRLFTSKWAEIYQKGSEVHIFSILCISSPNFVSQGLFCRSPTHELSIFLVLEMRLLLILLTAKWTEIYLEICNYISLVLRKLIYYFSASIS